MVGELGKPENNGGTPGGDTLFENIVFECPAIGPDEAALYVQGLTKTFGSGEKATTAVRDVSFAVEQGEVIGLLGPNGAGKTTTIKSILGLVLPDEGMVRINGIDPYAQPRRAYEHIDAMFEGARNDYWRLTVRENLRYFAAMQGLNPDEVTNRHEDLLNRLDLDDRANTQVRNLSRGMKQKVSLASILAANVSIAFLDEPTLGLDIETSLKLRGELMSLVEEQDISIILASHDMDLIEAVCDRIIIMNDGRIIANDTVGNLVNGFTTRGYRITASNVDKDVFSTIRQHFNVKSGHRIDGKTQFKVIVDSKGFYRLTDFMERHGIELVTVESVQQDLSEVFIEITEKGESAKKPTTDGGGGESL